MLPLFRFHSVVSTNTTARRLLRVKSGHFAVVATRQSGGRGQFDRKWDSQVGGLYLTIVIEINHIIQNIDFQTVICQTIAPAVVRAIQSATGHQPEIEWPNDLMLGDRKVGGILVEGVSVGTTLRALIIGIGVNVNQQDFPDPISRTATSLGACSGSHYNVDTLLNLIIKETLHVAQGHSWRNCFGPKYQSEHP